MFLARMVRTWKQALFIVQPATLLRWHRQGFQLYWKYKSRAASYKPKVPTETVALIQEMAAQNRRLRSGTYSRRITQAGHSRLQTHHSEVHGACSHTATRRSEPVHLLAPSCQRHLGLRLSSSHKALLPFADRLLHYRIAISQSDPCRRDTLSHRRLDRTAASGSHGVWTGPKYLLRDNDRKFGVGFVKYG